MLAGHPGYVGLLVVLYGQAVPLAGLHVHLWLGRVSLCSLVEHCCLLDSVTGQGCRHFAMPLSHVGLQTVLPFRIVPLAEFCIQAAAGWDFGLCSVIR